jgi:hypothetical protein
VQNAPSEWCEFLNYFNQFGGVEKLSELVDAKSFKLYPQMRARYDSVAVL